MFKKHKKPLYRRVTNLSPGSKKRTSKKLIGFGVVSAIAAGIAGAFVTNKERSQ